jgi:ketosteroid isomerase-like protein
MSQEDLEIVRQANEAFESGDLSAAMRAVHPDLVTYRADPDAGTFHGREGFLEAFADWLEGFADYGFTAEEYFDAGDRVLVRFRQWGRGETSTAAVEGPVWLLYTVSESRITRLEIYNSERRALEAAGLSE